MYSGAGDYTRAGVEVYISRDYTSESELILRIWGLYSGIVLEIILQSWKFIHVGFEDYTTELGFKL